MRLLFPLNRHQRDLISIFVEHLRSLAEWQEGKAHTQLGGEYNLILRLLLWKFCSGQEYSKAKVAEEHGERFCELLKGAASTDPIARWRRKLKQTELSAAKMERLSLELALITKTHDELLKDLNSVKGPRDSLIEYPGNKPAKA